MNLMFDLVEQTRENSFISFRTAGSQKRGENKGREREIKREREGEIHLLK